MAKIEKLENIIKHQKGQIRDLRKRVFGKKSEKKNSNKKGGNDPKNKGAGSTNNRGQQPGTKGHGHTTRPNFPCIEESANFSENPKCSKCGIEYTFDGQKESESIEVEVKAYTRVIKRSCMKKGCNCIGIPNTITAPISPKFFPRSPYEISIWENVLLSKFHYCQPANRLLG